MFSFISWDIDPVIFSFGIEIRWYSLAWGVGIVSGYYSLKVLSKNDNLLTVKIDELVLTLMVGIILGARLGHILFYDPVYYWHNPLEILPFRFSPELEFIGFRGLASHGGFLGALTALYIFKRKYSIDYLKYIDILTISASILAGFIRLGNLMNSEIVGTTTSVPWAFQFKKLDNLPRHPTSLYEALGYFMVAFILWMWWKKRENLHRSGFYFGIGISLIFSMRFLIEFIKENQVGFEDDLWLNMGQILSIPVIIAGITLAYFKRKKDLIDRSPEIS